MLKVDRWRIWEAKWFLYPSQNGSSGEKDLKVSWMETGCSPACVFLWVDRLLLTDQLSVGPSAHPITHWCVLISLFLLQHHGLVNIYCKIPLSFHILRGDHVLGLKTFAHLGQDVHGASACNLFFDVSVLFGFFLLQLIPADTLLLGSLFSLLKPSQT